MFRLLPTFKGRHFVKFLPFPGSFYGFSSVAAASCHGVSPNENQPKSKAIDLDLLFGACTSLPQVKSIHAFLVVAGRAHDKFLSTKLVNLYSFLGDIRLSRIAFDQTPQKDVYTWNSMISAYVRSGNSHGATDYFHRFVFESGLRPDFYTFPPVLKACRNLFDGTKIHCLVLKLGFEWDMFVAASLVHMYSRFGLVVDARRLFDAMSFRDMGSWNAMISGYCQSGYASEALGLSDEMRLKGHRMDPVTLASLLPACAQLGDITKGKLIHLYAIKHRLDFDLFVANALINMYAKFGNLGDAQLIFDRMTTRDVVSWNSLISAYEQAEDPTRALRFFYEMQLVGFQGDSLTLISLASSVAQLGDIRGCRSVHGFVIRSGWVFEDIIVGNAIIDMYAKVGLVDYARAIFEGLPVKDAVSWNTMITGYTQNGLATEAIEVYNTMERCTDMIPNHGTWVSILPAYSHVGALRQGMKIHGRLIKSNIYMDVFVGTCLVDMYGKCGQLNDSLSLFYEIPRNSSIPWNAVIACHGVHGHGERAVQLFREMVDDDVDPDHVTFVSLLSACSHSGLVDEGRWCFRVMQENYNIKPSLKHYGCMVDLYGRAGCLDAAYDFIKSMPIRPDASIWGALLGACKIHGHIHLGKLASERLFQIDPGNIGYYVLLSNMYANAGKWDGVDDVRSQARHKGLRKTPGWSSMEVNNKVEVFYTGNQTHPSYQDIHNELRDLHARMKNLGYVPDYSFVLQDVEEDEKEHILLSHSERLAMAFGIISTPKKATIRIFKNLRVCGDCHTATKYISRITEREIVVRDSNRFHHFKDGACSCGDYW